MEAVYILAGVEKAVPEVLASRYDIRYLLNGCLDTAGRQQAGHQAPAHRTASAGEEDPRNGH